MRLWMVKALRPAVIGDDLGGAARGRQQYRFVVVILKPAPGPHHRGFARTGIASQDKALIAFIAQQESGAACQTTPLLGVGLMREGCGDMSSDAGTRKNADGKIS
jgi:hypothetical protein